MKKPVALVTGSGRGIGKGIAECLAESGFDLVVNGVKEQSQVTDSLSALEERGANVLYVQADISQSDDRENLVTAIKQHYGSLQILVNNAGVGPKARQDILQATEESYDWVMDVNLKGPYFLTQKIANWMIEQQQETPKANYYIINVASISSYTSSPGRGEYCISKAGMSMMTQLYADRLAEYNIPVYEIRPGIIATDMTSKVQEKYDNLIAGGLLPMKRWGTPRDIGLAVLSLVKGHFPYSTGQVLDVDGGFHMHRL